jgi:2-polyprenyl-3-methyl-5-hydroxy-6-metoxy-1,4-benzoquinol methylase
MAEYYAASENYEFWAKNIFPASEDVRRERIHRPRFTQIVELCRRYGVGTELLIEIGPGAGTFLELATAEGAFQRAVGVEPNPAMAAACRARGVEVLEHPVEASGESAIAADVVAAFEVIEHVFAPREFVQQCHRMMRHGAMLVLTCPNGEGFDVATLQAQSSAIDPEHVNLFNPASLARLLTDGGFEILDCETPGRLDAELVRGAALGGRVNISNDVLLRTILIERWNDLGAAFQRFLVRHHLSSHLWMVARKF